MGSAPGLARFCWDYISRLPAPCVCAKVSRKFESGIELGAISASYIPMPYTILVVEDNQGLRESMALYLRKLNHNVYEAQTVEKGMEQARQIEFDVAIADYRLADGLGLDLLTNIHSVSPKTKKILVTGVSSSELLMKSAAAGIICLFKPFSLDSLISELNKKSA
jgi:DNA-binding NtrC family response regulator